MRTIFWVLIVMLMGNWAMAQVVAVQDDNGSRIIAGNATPLTIAVEGYASSALVVKADNGTLTGGNGQYVITPATPDSVCTIHVSVKIKGRLKEVKQLEIPVECLKIDKVGFAGKTRGSMPLAQAQAGNKLYCRMADYDFAVPAYVINCTVIVIRDRKEIFNKTLTNKTEVNFEGTEVSDMLKVLKPGDNLQFKNIEYRTPGNCKGSVAPMDFIII